MSGICPCGIHASRCDYHRPVAPEISPSYFGISRSNHLLADLSDKDMLSFQTELNAIIKRLCKNSLIWR